MKKYLVIASCQGYDYKTISPWINSLNSCGFKGDKIIIGIDISDELKQQIIDSGVDCYRVKSSENKNRFIERFKHLADFLTFFKESYEYIITTDIRDVIFQKNPEEWIRNNIKSYNIIASSESIKIKDENWNKYQFYAALGHDIAKSLEDYEVQNVGILAGSTEMILKISKYLYYEGLKATNSTADQPLFMHKVYTELKDETLFSNLEDAWSLNCGVIACDRTENEFKNYLIHKPPYMDKDNIIRNHKHEEIYIIHQYDRSSAWKNILLKKYQDNSLEIYHHLKNISLHRPIPIEHQNYLYKLKEEFNFSPKVIYDIGACVLHWTNISKEVWPNSKYILFEAMEESERLFKEFNYEYQIGVLSDTDNKEVIFYKNTESPGGNSYYLENSEYSSLANDLYGNTNNQFKRKTMTLDTIRKNRNFPYPDLIKIDVQGCEIDILNGAKETIKNTKHLIVELQHVQYNIGAKLVEESIPIIENMGFKLISPKFAVNSADADYHFIKV
jgi:FkbM family methyltransferase